MAHAGMLAIVSSAELEGLVQQVADALAVGQPAIVHGTCYEGAQAIQTTGINPRYLLIDLATRRDGALQEIDALAQLCEPGTRVVAIGQVNDIQFYRTLTDRGIPDYFPLPAQAADIVASFRRQEAPSAPAPAATSGSAGEVFGFMSAAGGDGASMAAINTAYAIAEQTGKRTVLVDLDYQYGMAARNLNLTTQYGIKDLFEHPDRGIDATIIQRMVATYGPLHVIAAPSDLRFLPTLESHSVTELIRILKQSYANVIIDLPHVWQPWVAAAARETNSLVIVAQLWLKSVSHAARILRAARDQNALPNDVRIVINRSGAKFKEAIEPRDFERVAGLSISHTLANDIKTVVEAENQAKTVVELGTATRLKADLENLARLLKGQKLETAEPVEARAGLQSILKKFS
jgi:pilus assembly protein CpaE